MNIPTITFENESINFTTPSWDDLNQLAFEISQKIIGENKKFDRIVTLAKGGWPMTRSLVDFLSVKEVASIGVKFYKGIDERFDQPEIYQDLPVSVKGESILLFDDVADTGESLLFVKDYLQSLEVKSITTAALFYKPHSKIKPDYYGGETNAWIIFPYDMHEAIQMFVPQWLKEGKTKEEINQRFLKLGFNKNWVDFLTQKL